MSEPRRILLAEDESTLRLAVATALRREAYEVVPTEDGEIAWAAWLEAEAAAKPFDLLLLDISMPRLDGRELLGRVRARDRALPAMFVTSRDEEFDRVLGLDLGADDYLCKPFSLKELLARVRALLRRAEAARSSPASAPASARGAQELPLGVASQSSGGRAAEEAAAEQAALGPAGGGPGLAAPSGLRLDPERFEARLGASPLKLTLTEFRMLECFLKAPGVVRSREVLVAAAYPEEIYLSDRAVDCHIKRIRRKLEEAGGEPTLIETVYGLGYRLAERA